MSGRAGPIRVRGKNGRGSLLCWGSNVDGQLGDETGATSFPSPVPVTSVGTTVVEVALGESFTCARRSDGTVLCWGRNNRGQLGDSTTHSRSSPVPVTGLGVAATQITAGLLFACARCTDGTVSCWGSNGKASLGRYDRRPDGLSPSRPWYHCRRGLGWFSTCLCAAYRQAASGAGDSASPVESVTAPRYGGYPRPSSLAWGRPRCRSSRESNQRGHCLRMAACWVGVRTRTANLGPQSTPSWTPIAPTACNDGVCAFDEAMSGACPTDCAARCGDCVCDGALETATSCPADCVPGGSCTPSACGNARCEADETCALCPGDCGTCYTSCGKFGCEPGETCTSCPGDCGACAAPVCGNASCDAGESWGRARATAERAAARPGGSQQGRSARPCRR